MDVIHVMAPFKSVMLRNLAECLPRLTPTPPPLLHNPRTKRSEGQSGACVMNEAARRQRTKGSSKKGYYTPSSFSLFPVEAQTKV